MKLTSNRFIALLMCIGLLAGYISPAWAQTPVASPVASPVAAEPSFEEAACMYDLPKGLTEDDVECGWLTSPMYPDGSKPGTVRLPIIKVLATTETPAPEPLVILLGGPGQNMSAVLPLFGDDAPLWKFMLERQDVILFDQRGMGLSEPSLECSIEEKMRNGTVESNLAVGVGLTRCGNELRANGIDPAAFTTVTNASDLESMRVAMGYEQLDLYGISYGSRLALVAIRDYPESIRASIIASPLPLENNVFADQVIGFDAALKYVWDACAADAECAAANPDPAGALLKAVERLEAEPMVVTVTNPATGDKLDLPIDAMQFMQILYLGVFIGPIAPALPYLVTEVAAGDDTVLQTLAPFMVMPSQLSMGALFTYMCQDEIPFEPVAESSRLIDDAGVIEPIGDDTFIGLGAQMYPLCRVWNFPASDPMQNEPVVSDEPLLIMTGSMDPITPPENGPIIAANFPNSQLVNFVAGGHDPASTAFGCSEDIITGFLNDPSAPVDAACADTPIDFSVPEEGVNATGTPGATPVATPEVGN